MDALHKAIEIDPERQKGRRTNRAKPCCGLKRFLEESTLG